MQLGIDEICKIERVREYLQSGGDPNRLALDVANAVPKNAASRIMGQVSAAGVVVSGAAATGAAAVAVTPPGEAIAVAALGMGVATLAFGGIGYGLFLALYFLGASVRAKANGLPAEAVTWTWLQLAAYREAWDSLVLLIAYGGYIDEYKIGEQQVPRLNAFITRDPCFSVPDHILDLVRQEPGEAREEAMRQCSSGRTTSELAVFSVTFRKHGEATTLLYQIFVLSNGVLSIQAHDKTSFFKCLAQIMPQKKAATIFVHGYNNSQKDAIATAQALSDSSSVAIDFSWPSNESVVEYIADAETARVEGRLFATCFKEIIEELSTKPINVFAHSLGSRIVVWGLTEVYKNCKDEKSRCRPAQNVVFSAADENRRIFSEFTKDMRQYRPETTITILTCKADLALRFGMKLTKNAHVGFFQEEDYHVRTDELGVFQPENCNVVVVDAAIPSDFVGHGYHRENKLRRFIKSVLSLEPKGSILNVGTGEPTLRLVKKSERIDAKCVVMKLEKV